MKQILLLPTIFLFLISEKTEARSFFSFLKKKNETHYNYVKVPFQKKEIKREKVVEVVPTSSMEIENENFIPSETITNPTDSVTPPLISDDKNKPLFSFRSKKDELKNGLKFKSKENKPAPVIDEPADSSVDATTKANRQTHYSIVCSSISICCMVASVVLLVYQIVSLSFAAFLILGAFNWVFYISAFIFLLFAAYYYFKGKKGDKLDLISQAALLLIVNSVLYVVYFFAASVLAIISFFTHQSM